MTNRNETPRRSPLADASLRAAALALAASAALLAPVAGCGGEEEQSVVAAPPPAPPPPPPPEAPKVTPIAELMKELGISPKVRMQEDHAPDTDPERIAVLKFFDAFAKGTPDTIASALSPIDRATLEASARSGALKRDCDAISRVDLFASSSASDLGSAGADKGPSAWPEGAPTSKCGTVLAVYRAGGRTQAQLWVFEAEGEGKKVTRQAFHGIYQPPEIMSKVSGNSLRTSWMQVVRKELALAAQPDETLRPVARVEAQEAPEAAPASKGSGPIGAPPGRNRPKKTMDPPRSLPGR